jgi:hypothetical protein
MLFWIVEDPAPAIRVESRTRMVSKRSILSSEVTAVFKADYNVRINPVGVGMHVKGFVTSRYAIRPKVRTKCVLNIVPIVREGVGSGAPAKLLFRDPILKIKNERVGAKHANVNVTVLAHVRVVAVRALGEDAYGSRF